MTSFLRCYIFLKFDTEDDFFLLPKCALLYCLCVLRSSDNVSLELGEDGEQIVNLSMKEWMEDDFEMI